MMMEKETLKSKWWWIGNHNTSDLSPWLQSTLADMDAKTKAMLRVIEEDADSFAKRAEMYYKKRPELVAMVEDLYRTYRSLAERYDLARSCSLHKHTLPEKSTHVPENLEKSTFDEESRMVHVPDIIIPEKSTHVLETPKKSTFNEEESWVTHVLEIPEKSTHVLEGSAYNEESWMTHVLETPKRSTTFNEESWMIHVPETPEKSPHVLETPKKSTFTEESWMLHVPETPEKSTSYKQESWSYASEIEEYPESEVDNGESIVDDVVTDDDFEGGEGEGDVESIVFDDEDEAMARRMKEEMERLREENRVYSELLRQRDEEKREAIRQLSFAVEMLKEENLELKKCVSAASKQKEEMSPKKQLWGPFQFKQLLKEGFLGRNWQLGI